MVSGSLVMDVHSLNQKSESWSRLVSAVELSSAVMTSSVHCVTTSFWSASSWPIATACHSVASSMLTSVRPVMDPSVVGSFEMDE